MNVRFHTTKARRSKVKSAHRLSLGRNIYICNDKQSSSHVKTHMHDFTVIINLIVFNVRLYFLIIFFLNGVLLKKLRLYYGVYVRAGIYNFLICWSTNLRTIKEMLYWYGCVCQQELPASICGYHCKRRKNIYTGISATKPVACNPMVIFQQNIVYHVILQWKWMLG